MPCNSCNRSRYQPSKGKLEVIIWSNAWPTSIASKVVKAVAQKWFPRTPSVRMWYLIFGEMKEIFAAGSQEVPGKTAAKLRLYQAGWGMWEQLLILASSNPNNLDIKSQIATRRPTLADNTQVLRISPHLTAWSVAEWILSGFSSMLSLQFRSERLREAKCINHGVYPQALHEYYEKIGAKISQILGSSPQKWWFQKPHKTKFRKVLQKPLASTNNVNPDPYSNIITHIARYWGWCDFRSA